MIGYTTQAEAIAAGCTHHGSYYGIPLWMGDIDSEAPLVFAKWAPLDCLIGVFAMVEYLLAPLVYGPGADPGFRFKLLGEIKEA